MHEVASQNMARLSDVAGALDTRLTLKQTIKSSKAYMLAVSITLILNHMDALSHLEELSS